MDDEPGNRTAEMFCERSGQQLRVRLHAFGAAPTPGFAGQDFGIDVNPDDPEPDSSSQPVRMPAVAAADFQNRLVRIQQLDQQTVYLLLEAGVQRFVLPATGAAVRSCPYRLCCSHRDGGLMHCLIPERAAFWQTRVSSASGYRWSALGTLDFLIYPFDRFFRSSAVFPATELML